jgi:DNA helicase-2/ATP-dependent DNA helicase PcrA
VVTNYRYSASDIATLLGGYEPTSEQAAIIEAPLEGVYRVVAGAGSGKTETMALRVVWLVANGYVKPHEVLGLTFTRKAASELGARITKRIRALPDLPDADIFQMPQVSTYNAFASRLFQDYSVYLGLEGEVDVAGQAAAWSVARSVVQRSTHPGLPDLDYSVDRLATLTWNFAQAVSEHNVDLDELDGHTEQIQALTELPLGGRGAAYEREMTAIVGSQSLLPILVQLVREFTAEKRARGLVEYSDQVRLALEVTKRAPDVVDQMRERYKVVLLDEYQDTSVLQTELLSQLFSNHPVMSVGDPHQAIYGWRGASAANLADFHRSFATDYAKQSFELQVSWRNPRVVLDAANTVASPLRNQQHDVGVLRPKPDAPDGVLDVIFEETVDDEAAAVAEWFAQKMDSPAEPPSAALLVRSRKHQTRFAHALTARGIPVHILGIGGLLQDPVVAEIVCALSVVHRSHANGELVRLLTSGRFRVGVSDLYQLSEVARWLGHHDVDQVATDDRAQALLDEAVGRPAASLADALDYLVRVPSDHHQWARFSDRAKDTLTDAAQMINAQRKVSHESLTAQVAHWEKISLLDIEWRANPSRTGSDNAREAFFDAIGQYQAISDEAGAAGFLDWLEQAEWRDSLQPRSEPAEPGCVQILTIHGAKGLEWDLVAVVRAVADELPGKSREGSSGWLAPGVLPYPFRGDRDYLPHFHWKKQETRKDLVDSYKAFRGDVQAYHLAEERRLAYVAMTRAKEGLVLSGSFWAHQQKPRTPSVFLQELASYNIVAPLPEGPRVEEAPQAEVDTMVWPADPLGTRRPNVESAADNVLAAVETGLECESDLREQIDRIIADEASRLVPEPPKWPVRIPASQFDRWVFEPEVMLQARLQPRPATIGLAQQQGTLFHEWVEGFYAESVGSTLSADVDLDGDELIEYPEDVRTWQEAFSASRYASMRPLALEREIHYPLAGHVIICKIDAVFDNNGRVLIIDWKTGREPQGPDQTRRKALQLALYRLAWADWTGVDVETVDAAFWFSATDHTLQPESLPGREELEKLIASAKGEG